MLGPDRPVFRRDSATLPAAKPHPLTADQAQAVRRFVAQVGGFENARRALEMLALLSRRAA